MCSLESYMEGEGREVGGSGRKTSQDIPLEFIKYCSGRYLKNFIVKGKRWCQENSGKEIRHLLLLLQRRPLPSISLYQLSPHNGSSRSIEVWETKLALFHSSSEALLRFANRCDNKS